MTGRTYTALLLILVAVFSRLIPHPWNLTAVGSVTLFAGAYLKPRAGAFAVPLVAFFITDLILGFHNTMYFTYGALAISSALGIGLLKKPRPVSVFGLSVVSSLIFFGLSNFGVWVVGGLYPQTWLGLSNCFLMALPFFQGQLLGDLFYSGALFGIYAYVAKRIPAEPKITI